ncbi:MAG TPA: tetratricopeptide repeat protein [Gemmataceae bacterium]|nr:tetratricopeptide repeat protein [Gemmataceae bacterium]
MSIADRLPLAVQLRREGRRDEAERLLREVAAAEPGSGPVLHLLGLIAYETGRAGDAVDWFGKAIAAAPADAFYRSCLGTALHAAGRLDDAEQEHRRALECKPRDGTVLNNLGITLAALGRHAEAEAAFRGALKADPDDAAGLCNLAAALRAQGKLDEAASACREALRIAPSLAQTHTNLGNVLQEQGRPDEAEACHRRALELQPRLACAWRNLAALLRRRGRLTEAVQAWSQALRLAPHDAPTRVGFAEVLLDLNRGPEALAQCREALGMRPDDPDAHNALGGSLAALGRLDEAAACYAEAARLRPSWAVPLYNRGVVLQGQGRLAEARDSYREALRIDPADHVAHSTFVGSLLFDPDVDGERLLAESRRWADAHAPLPAAVLAHPNTPDPSRRLRVGYVSPDLRSHPVAFFLGPVLELHDPAAVEVFCYADVAAPDDTTARLRGLAHHWRPTRGLSDDELEALVRRDGIDVLVDLCGHLAHHRLRVFGRRPAPVQVSWLGYPASTGLTAIDYRLTDAVCDPPGEPSCSSEELFRLEGPFCCYAPPLQVAQRPNPPAASSAVVFASLHKLDKLNDQVADLWARLLHEVPESRLLLCRNTLQGETADLWRDRFVARGLPEHRVELRHIAPTAMRHLRLYDEIDVALDAFPWSGHTTACEALWMGVPVVTLRGRLCAGRMVASVLTAVGLNDLVAATPEEYVHISAGLARDAARRAELRRSLRPRMLRSPLCDKARFTRGLEDSYRRMWRTWRDGRAAPAV